MKTFDQAFVHDVAQDMYDQKMRTKYVSILQNILCEAENGEFSIFLPRLSLIFLLAGFVDTSVVVFTL